MSPTTQALMILLLPLCGFLVQIFVGKKLPRQGDFVPTLMIFLSCLLAWNIFGTEVLPRDHGIDIKEVTLVARDAEHGSHKVRGRLVKQTDELYYIEPRGAAHHGAAHGEDAHGGTDGHGDGHGDELADLLAVPRADVVSGPYYSFRTELFHIDGETWLGIGREVTPGDNVGSASRLEFRFGILIDNLTAIMLVVVTTVSFLVHLYSTGYMIHHGHRAPRYNRFFAFLGLFSVSMLGLILTDNVFFLFCFWELVGLCSYFLIGFEFERQAACRASIKAFITTRIGDCGLFIALMIIGAVVGRFTFAEIFASVQQGQWEPWLLTTAAILMFIGPVGKSAQFPLHVWLPDAMEGPTPVSALIHAATMVVAGVYLIARMFPFFVGVPFFAEAMDVFSSTPLTVVAFVGGFTSLFAATIALVQGDLKKVLAYSTVSQLGYMVLAMGVGSIAAGAFHLWTHAFFKACLFLGAGSVIHAMDTNQMKLMGGLRAKMPVTFYTFLISTMAIAGVPLLSGFFSKEAVLTQAFMYGQVNGGLHYLPFAFGMITAVLTPFYMFRAVCLTFMGKPRDRERFDHAHESPWNMTVPLLILGVLAVFAGGIWSLGEAAPVLIFPIIACFVFFTRPYGKTVGAALLVMFLCYGYNPIYNGIKAGLTGELPASVQSHGGHGDGHGDGHGEAGHGQAKGEKSFGELFKAAALGVKTSEWFNNRIGNHLFFDQMAVHASPDMVHGRVDDSGHHAHGCLVEPALPPEEASHMSHAAHSIVMLLSLICATMGIGFAWVLYLGPMSNETIAPKGGALAWYRRVLENLYYMDHIYWFLFVDGLMYVRRGFAWFDRSVIDAFVNGVAAAVMDLPPTARDLDRQALGLGRGSALMVGVFGFALIGASLGGLVYDSGASMVSLDVGPFGVFEVAGNLLCGTGTTVLLAVAAAVIMTLAGIRKGAAVLAACIFALSGFIGTSLAHRIATWAAQGPEQMSAMLAPFAAHPVAGTLFMILLVTFILGVWAGMGIDGTVRFLGETIALGMGRTVRKVQTGRLQDYLLATVFLTVVVIVVTAML